MDFPLRSLITRGIQSVVELCTTFKPPTVRFTKPAPCHGENSVFGELAMVLNISKAFLLHIPSTFFPWRLRECHPLQLHIFCEFQYHSHQTKVWYGYVRYILHSFAELSMKFAASGWIGSTKDGVASMAYWLWMRREERWGPSTSVNHPRITVERHFRWRDFLSNIKKCQHLVLSQASWVHETCEEIFVHFCACIRNT